MEQLLIATHNRGKLREFAGILSGLPFELATLDDVGITQDVEETGATLEENARLKALTYARQSGLLALADDSGLEVDALDGAPGVYSKRYAGGEKSDAERNAYVLEKMRTVPPTERTARFRCVIVIANANGQTWTSQGTCEGEIALSPRGTNGFGYDPIFIVRGGEKHLAEFSAEEKNKISHRGRAAVGAYRTLEQLWKQKSDAG